MAIQWKRWMATKIHLDHSSLQLLSFPELLVCLISSSLARDIVLQLFPLVFLSRLILFLIYMFHIQTYKYSVLSISTFIV
jgi:hypothetical protein